MSKQEQFLWIVQTILLANVGNIASQPEYAEKFRHVVSATGVSFTASEAVRASELIPTSMTATEAADEFCGYMLENLRPKGAEVPSWFALS